MSEARKLLKIERVLKLLISIAQSSNINSKPCCDRAQLLALTLKPIFRKLLHKEVSRKLSVTRKRKRIRVHACQEILILSNRQDLKETNYK